MAGRWGGTRTLAAQNPEPRTQNLDLLGSALTAIDHCHTGAVAGVQAGAPLRRPAPVVGDSGPATGDHVEAQGALWVPAHADRRPLGVGTKVQTLLQVPVVVPHHPQLDCGGQAMRTDRSGSGWSTTFDFLYDWFIVLLSVFQPL